MNIQKTNSLTTSNAKLLKDIEADLNFYEIKQEFITLFRSPNPIQVYLNFQKVKDKFSSLLSVLTLKIKDGFKLESIGEKTFLMTIYKQSNYDQIWLDLTEYYLRDSRNFNLLDYLFYVKTLNKDKEQLAKALLKLYKNESLEEVNRYLVECNSKNDFEDVKDIFETYNIKEMKFNINFREDFVERFIEKIYLSLNESKRSGFLDNFILRLNRESIDFSDMLKVILKIISNYVSGDKYVELQNILNNRCFREIKASIDDLISNYEIVKGDFYIRVNEILSTLGSTDRSLFWKYIKTKMINTYHSNVRYIFYDYSSSNFLDKNTYFTLKGNLEIKPSISPESEYINSEYKEINDLKEIILELNDNLFSFFLLPVIYYTISERLSLKKEDLYKMKYLLLFIFSNDYSEYKKIYMFFNQLEVFLNYENKPKVWEKAQVGFSIILMVTLLLITSYLYLPIGIFAGILALSLVKANEVIYPHSFYKSKWNVGIKFFAIVLVCISSYFWLSNFDKVKLDMANLTAQIKALGTIPSKEVVNNSINYIKIGLLDSRNVK